MQAPFESVAEARSTRRLEVLSPAPASLPSPVVKATEAARVVRPADERGRLASRRGRIGRDREVGGRGESRVVAGGHRLRSRAGRARGPGVRALIGVRQVVPATGHAGHGREGDLLDTRLEVARHRVHGERAGVSALRVVVERRAGDVLVRARRALTHRECRGGRRARIDLNELGTDRLLVSDPIVGPELDGRRDEEVEGSAVDRAVDRARVRAVGCEADLLEA